MSPAPTPIETLVTTLDERALTLLPTAESARSFRRAFDDAQRARGLQAWQPANILSWQQFLDRLWSDAIVTGIDPRLLLNATQEHALWLDTVSNTTDTLASSDALATLCAEAWSLANAYNAAPRLRATATTHDSRTFAIWAEAFTRECTRNQYLTRSVLETALAQHITTHALTAPATLTLIGFNNLTPAQQSLLEALRTAGTTITENAFASTTPTSHLHSAPSEPDELRAIAHYLRTFLETTDHPQHIAVLLPDPTDAPALETTFREILAPELQSITADTSSAPWQFPNAGPLATQPILATALDLAHFAQASIDLNQVSALILSPYLGAKESDRNTAARFDAESLRKRKRLRPEIDLTALHHLAQSSEYAPAWIKPLHHFLTNTNLDTPRTHAAWAEFLRSLLAAANWPGPRTLTSLEYQATEAWDALLDQLSTLDFRGRRIPFADFLSILTRQAITTQFTPASTNAPIQILSPTAAIAQHFDLIVFARATDTNYPPAEHTNPLLSFALQSQLDMPGANQSNSNARGHHRIEQLLQSSGSALITYAAQAPEGPQHLASVFHPFNSSELQISAPQASQPLREDLIPDTAPLPALTSTFVHGGARVLQLQAACGFRAFAEFRLNAKDLETIDLGFDAAESGSHLHHALQLFWKQVETQDNLRSMSVEQREELLTDCVHLATQTQPAQTPWEKAYLAMQRQRLVSLLLQWLERELDRSPFTVLDREHKDHVPIGPLTLELRYDRIDKLAEGFALVDYKTGASGHPNQWTGDRPDDPQLPLYALPYEPGELRALTFAKVRAGEMKWLGYQQIPGILPASRVNQVVDLTSLIEEWRTILHQLAHDFAEGRASVSPKRYPKTCEYCAQRLLCRVDPATLLASTEDDDTSEPVNG